MNGVWLTRSSPQRDIDEVDIALPVHIKDILNQFFIVVGLIFILSFVSPVVLAVIVPLVLLFIFIQTAYLRSSRQLKRLAAVNRSHSVTFGHIRPHSATFGHIWSNLVTFRRI